ncbi:hypothetical protein [Caulobacter rhizosphaerae]|uniref:hypothetical protein n=1 Tax=Caulobacter rhizosphaerae TaxID=2010972 RepID=UPI0013D0787D|nr:hypothetical protein [Caulobacter rhizosphaerae]GGL48173.1 hypothetical protein GCM10010983_51920 [Caulobacter rhizosphaerae]
MAASHRAPVAANDAGPKLRRQVYCPPAPVDGLVYRTFRQTFWGARYPVLVEPPLPAGPPEIPIDDY